MVLSVLIILVIAACIPLFHLLFRDKTPYLLALLPLSLFTWLLWQYLGGGLATPQREVWTWNSYFQLELAFYLDGLSLLFSLLITGIGVLIYLYAGPYMKGARYYRRFFMSLTVFMGSMLGLVLADNLLALIVFWEMTSITSFLLIGYDHEQEKSRYAALQGLLVTASGGLALLAGLILLGIVTQEYTISALAQYREQIVAHSLYLPILLCVLLGAFTKSAQAPFHFWLPNAMAAPTPVSAYLHSATMVKAGVFFLARFWPVLGGTPEWTLLLTAVGGLTALTGGVLAFGAQDLKRILAYSTVSALGLMVLTFGVGTRTAIYAGISLIVAHGLYKSSLFMLAGIIDKGSGTRSLQELPARLYERMPLAFWLVLAAALSLGGILPFFGFVAKELLVEAALSAPSRKYVLTGVVLLTGALFVAVLLMLTHQAFFQPRGASSDRRVKKLSFAYYLPPLVSALAGLLFGLFPGLLSDLFSLGAQSLDPALPAKSLSLWHGWNTALMLSLLSIAAGAGLYAGRRPLKARWPAGALRRFAPSRAYDRLVDGMLRAATWHTQVIQNGQLRYYVMATMFSLLLLTSFTFFYKEGVTVQTLTPDVLVFEVILLGIMLMALAFILTVRYRIDSLLGLGIVGIVISIVFLEGGAPDLAITFFLIDTLTIILFVLILHRLPKRVAPKSRFGAARDLLIAAGMGVMVTCLLLAITDAPLDSRLKDFYAGSSYAMAEGRNIVNVILVDFRSLDTFGEIIVLAIAAFGVYAIVTFSNQKDNA